MSIDYYLADLKNRRLFEIGTHRHVYASVLRDLVVSDRSLFALGCAWRTYDEALRLGDEDKKAEEHATYAAQQANAIFDFAAEADFQIELVNDCEDRLFDLLDAGWPKTHSIYAKDAPDSTPVPGVLSVIAMNRRDRRASGAAGGRKSADMCKYVVGRMATEGPVLRQALRDAVTEVKPGHVADALTNAAADFEVAVLQLDFERAARAMIAVLSFGRDLAFVAGKLRDQPPAAEHGEPN